MEPLHTKEDYYHILHRRERFGVKNRPLGCRTTLEVDGDLEQEFYRESESEEDKEVKQRQRGSAAARWRCAAARTRYNPRRVYYAQLAHAKEHLASWPAGGSARARSASPPGLRDWQQQESDCEPTPAFMKSWRKRRAAALKKDKVYQFMKSTRSELISSLDDGASEQQPWPQPMTPQTWPCKALGSQFTLAASPVPDSPLFGTATPSQIPAPVDAPSQPPTFAHQPPAAPLPATPKMVPFSDVAPQTPATPQPHQLLPTLPPAMAAQSAFPQAALVPAPPPPTTPASPSLLSHAPAPHQLPAMLYPASPRPELLGGKELSPLEQTSEEMRRAADAARRTLQELLLQLQQERALLASPAPSRPFP